MPFTRWRRVLGLAVLAGATTLALAEKAKVARFYGFTLGAPFKPDQRIGGQAPDFTVKKPNAFRGRKPDRVELVVEAGVLGELTLTYSASGKTPSTKLSTWAAAVCKWLGTRIARRTPSPPGTPKPGEPWDPVILTKGGCDAVRGGVQLSVHEREWRASDFHRVQVELIASVAPPPAR